jgi:hypothetical protein
MNLQLLVHAISSVFFDKYQNRTLFSRYWFLKGTDRYLFSEEPNFSGNRSTEPIGSVIPNAQGEQRQAPPPSRRGRLSVHTSHLRGRVREWLYAVWRRQVAHPPSRCRHLPVRASHHCGRDRERLRAVWRRLAPPPSVQARVLVKDHDG